VPGRVSFLSPTPRWTLASATVGIACASVHCLTCAALRALWINAVPRDTAGYGERHEGDHQ